jgi:Domain of Unknown Function (DUF1080)
MRPLFLSLLGLPLLVQADGGFYGDPPDATHPWAIHDMNRPQPAKVEPGSFSSQEKPGQPPSDAIVLFGGADKDIANWESDKDHQPTKWIVKDGNLQCVPGSGYIQSKELHSDCQLHLEWSAPTEVKGNSQGRGNSGVFLMGQVEVQVLDNHDNPTYADGFAGSVYGINPPMANPLRKPGEWQVYDIVFRRPVFKDGQQIDPGSLTVFCNGVLLQDHTALDGGGGHRGRSKARPFPETGPLKLQDHGNPVLYRNIWYRPLPKRAIEGGDASVMSPEATAAKRTQIAAKLRVEAKGKSGQDQLIKQMESLTYQIDADTLAAVTAQVDHFAAEIKPLDAAQLEAQKGKIMQMNSALQYLSKFSILPQPLTATDTIMGIIKAQEWDKKKK